jgi:hypothetical protein
MKYKSIISTVSFLLFSLFYVNSASAAMTYVLFKVNDACGKSIVMPNNHHCTNTERNGQDLLFQCINGTDGRGVMSIKTANCGRTTVTTFMNPANGFAYTYDDRKSHALMSDSKAKHFADSTNNNAHVKDQSSIHKKKPQVAQQFDVYVCPPGFPSGKINDDRKMCINLYDNYQDTIKYVDKYCRAATDNKLRCYSKEVDPKKFPRDANDKWY